MIEKKHLEEIDILKGIAIIYVILAHAVIVYPVNLHDIPWCKMIYDLVRITHMPLFFMVSGYCFSYKGGYPSYIKKKILRILVPYLVFGLVDIVPRALFDTLYNRPRNVGESLYNLAFYGGAKWFLYSLFLIFLIFPLIEKITVNKIIYFILLVIFVALKFIPGIPDLFLIKRTIYHLMYFMIGYGLKRFGFSVSKQTEILKRRKIIPVIIAVPVFALMFFAVPYYAIEDDQLLGIPLALLGIIFSFMIMSLITGSKISKPIVIFGVYSLQLYLFNSYFLGLSRTLIVSVMKQNHPLLIITCNIVFTLFVSILFIKHIVARFRITRFVTGIVEPVSKIEDDK